MVEDKPTSKEKLKHQIVVTTDDEQFAKELYKVIDKYGKKE